MDRLRRLRDTIEEDEVLNSASAIAFQVLSALIPLILFMLALLGFLHLGSVWSDAAKSLRPKLSPAAFTVLDSTVRGVVEHQQPFWLSAGLLLTLWRISSAMRAVMGALDRIYDVETDRPLTERLRISIGLAIAETILLLAALAVLHLGPLLVSVDGFALTIVSIVVRWTLAAALLLLAVGLVLHHAPAKRQSLGWVSFGTVVVVVAWVLGSVLFGLYVTKIASYGSLFGSFASIFVLLTYLYLSAIVFLAGVEVDAAVREEADGPTGASTHGRPVNGAALTGTHAA